MAEWQELPILIANVKTVLYDVKNDSVLYILKSLDEKDPKVIKLSLRVQLVIV